jgi:hypothetical protein
LSDSPTQLADEARLWQVRSKRLLCTPQSVNFFDALLSFETELLELFFCQQLFTDHIRKQDKGGSAPGIVKSRGHCSIAVSN